MYLLGYFQGIKGNLEDIVQECTHVYLILTKINGDLLVLAGLRW